jgi:hypothetical protein
MHRGYTADRYLAKLADARRHIADLAVSTDIIVGFPGETATDFERTLEVAAAAEYDYAYTFIYSPRPGTEAAAMIDRFVDPAVCGERFERSGGGRTLGARQAPSPHRTCRGSPRGGPVEKGSRGAQRPHPPEQARACPA